MILLGHRAIVMLKLDNVPVEVIMKANDVKMLRKDTMTKKVQKVFFWCRSNSKLFSSLNIDSLACDCTPTSSDGISCDITTGQCNCNGGFGGLKCDVCSTGHYYQSSPTPCQGNYYRFIQGGFRMRCQIARTFKFFSEN